MKKNHFSADGTCAENQTNIKMRVQTHERIRVQTSIILLKSPAEFTMICASKIFFHLVSMQGLIQTDLKPSALKRVMLHKWLTQSKLGKENLHVHICT